MEYGSTVAIESFPGARYPADAVTTFDTERLSDDLKIEVGGFLACRC